MFQILNFWSGRWMEVIWRVSLQSMIFAVAVFLVIKMLRGRLTPTVRHLLWTLVLLKFLITPFVTIPVVIPVKYQPAPIPNILKSIPVAPLPETSMAFQPSTVTTEVQAIPVRVKEKPASKNPLSLSLFLFTLWLSGAAVFLLWITIHSVRLCRQLSSAEPLDDRDIAVVVERGVKELKISPPKLKVSKGFSSPLVCGIFNPSLIIPEQVLEKFSPKEIEYIILHELAHIKRRDILSNWLQIISLSFHFFNPVVWYINRQIRIEREQACDDWVLQINNGERKNYADALVKVIELCSGSKNFALGILGISEPFSLMSRRLRMVMDTRRKICTRISVKMLLVLGLVGLVVIPGYFLTTVRAKSEENTLSQSVREDIIKKSLVANAFGKEFSGEIEIGVSGLGSIGKGKFWQKGKLFRTEVTISMPNVPESRQLITTPDGKIIWEWEYSSNYEELTKVDLSKLPEDIRSATEKKYGMYNYALLYEEITKIADVTEKTMENKRYYVLTVNALSSIKEFPQEIRENSDFKKILVWLDTNTYLISRIEIYGENTNLKLVDFKNLSVQPISDSVFSFVPPKGVEVVDKTDSILQSLQSKKSTAEYQIYQVNKTVVDFPEKEDLSTPESAYATVNRICASGDNTAWSRISASRLSKSFSSDYLKKKIKVKPEVANERLNALIIEVRIFRGVYAGVIAKFKDNSYEVFNTRSFELENGKWLNFGEDISESIEGAKDNFAKRCAWYVKQPVLPTSTLKPVLAGEQQGKTVSADANTSDNGTSDMEDRWIIGISLNMPDLKPQAVQWAVFEEDPVPAFRAAVERMRDFERKQLAKASVAERDIVRFAGMKVWWDAGFGKIPGDQIYLLTAVGSHCLGSNGPDGNKWIVSKVVNVRGKPVCWCLPVTVKTGRTVEVVLNKENIFPIEKEFDMIINSSKVEQPDKIVTQPVESAPSKLEMMGKVEDFFMNNFRDVTARKSLEWGDVETQKDGSHSIRYMYEARIWDRETMIMNQIFIFDRKGNFIKYENVAGFPKTKVPKTVDINSQAGMKELVEDFFQNNYRDITKRQSLEWGDVVKNKDGTSSIRYKFNAEIRGKEVKTMNKVFTFDSSGKFISVEDVIP